MISSGPTAVAVNVGAAGARAVTETSADASDHAPAPLPFTARTRYANVERPGACMCVQVRAVGGVGVAVAASLQSARSSAVIVGVVGPLVLDLVTRNRRGALVSGAVQVTGTLPAAWVPASSCRRPRRSRHCYSGSPGLLCSTRRSRGQRRSRSWHARGRSTPSRPEPDTDILGPRRRQTCNGGSEGCNLSGVRNGCRADPDLVTGDVGAAVVGWGRPPDRDRVDVEIPRDDTRISCIDVIRASTGPQSRRGRLDCTGVVADTTFDQAPSQWSQVSAVAGGGDGVQPAGTVLIGRAGIEQPVSGIGAMDGIIQRASQHWIGESSSGPSHPCRVG